MASLNVFNCSIFSRKRRSLEHQPIYALKAHTISDKLEVVSCRSHWPRI